MGEVYRATDSLLDRTVAVKMLAERHARNADVRARFKREALAAAQLSAHRHVVTVFDVGEHDGRPFIVMEYLEGGSLYDRLRSETVGPARALEWLSEAAEAVDAAHARGIVHRDVKPANLLLDAADSIHVTDFGIASAAGLDTLTLPGMVLGTAGYLAPEQARGEPTTAASDRYALGVVAFELLTGRRPFAADTPATEAFAHLNADVPSAEQLEPTLPAGVDAVFGRALAKAPSDRPASSRELVANLRDAFATDATPTLVQAPPRPPPSAPPTRRYERRGRRRAAYVAVAVGVLVAGLASAVLAARFDDESSQQAAKTPSGGSTATESRTTEAAETGATTTAPAESRPPTDGDELNDAGYVRMQDGDFSGALPLLERSVATLSGSGSLAEAYASYNLAFTRFALGSCEGVLPLLERSEAVQGHRREIDRLRREVDRACDAPRGKDKKNREDEKGQGTGGDD